MNELDEKPRAYNDWKADCADLFGALFGALIWLALLGLVIFGLCTFTFGTIIILLLLFIAAK